MAKKNVCLYRVRAKKTVPTTLLESNLSSGEFLEMGSTEVSESGFVIAESYSDAVQTFGILSGMRSPDFTVSPEPEPDNFKSRKEYLKFLRMGFCKLQRLRTYHSRLERQNRSKEYLDL